MTEAEALDMAAKAAGWRDWKEAHERTWELDGMRAHAATIMENAALKAENERLRGYAVHLPYCQSRIKGLHENPCTCGLSALLKEIEGD